MRSALKSLIPALVVVSAVAVTAQQQQQAPRRPSSPAGTAQTQVGGKWVTPADKPGAAPRYQDGKWIEVTYGRPISKGRENIFGSGADYGVAVRGGTPVWRAGANQTTVMRTEVPLVFGCKTLPAGEYGLLVDLKSPESWTLILTSQPRQKAFDANNKTDLIGAVNYDPKFDVIRVPMTVDPGLDLRLDQLTIFFCDVTKDGGKLAIAWETTVAMAEFKVGGAGR